MSDEVFNYMLVERDNLRKCEHDLTQKIRAERSRLSKLNKNKSSAEKGTKHYLELKAENKKLRQMCAVLAKSTYLTNQKVGEMLDVSTTRATQILRSALDDLEIKYKA